MEKMEHDISVHFLGGGGGPGEWSCKSRGESHKEGNSIGKDYRFFRDFSLLGLAYGLLVCGLDF
jgi:hypothetical protein